MTIIPCPDSQPIHWMKEDFSAWHLYSRQKAADASQKKALVALARKWIEILAHTECAEGCIGPDYRFDYYDAYVLDCTRWGIPVRCHSRARLDLQATCRQITMGDVLPDHEPDEPHRP